MTTNVQTSAGSILAISSSLPSTNDSTGFGALSFSNIGELVDMGEYGKKYTLVTHAPLATRLLQKFKGGYDPGTQQLVLGKYIADAGQALLLAASNSDAAYSFRITFQDGTHTAFTAKVMSFMTKISTLNTILGATAEVQITTDTVDY